MRPIRLQIQAFGPFADLVDLDFTKLDARSLFLISGPTGAGKTTVLDALCFALYHESSGSERKGPQLRSDFADGSNPTQVVLDFSHGDACYRVTRRPKQQLAKVRGEGTVDRAPEADLVRLDADGKPGELLASKINDCTKKITDILGLDADQFRQVILIPQGKFRQLLLAGSTEREKIFESLFHTERYRLIQERLKDRARDIVEERKLLRERMASVLEQSGAETREALQQQIATIETEQKALKKTVKKANADHQKLVAHLEEARKFSDLKTRLTSTKQSIAKATETKATADAQSKSIAASLKLEEAKEPEREKLRTHKLKLESLRSRISEYEKAFQVAAEQKTIWQNAAARLADYEKQLDDAGKNETRFASDLEKVRTLGAEAEGRRLLLRQSEERHQLFQRHTATTLKLKQLREGALAASLADGKNAAKSAELATKAHRELLQQRHDGRAASLATDLEDGAPCPVCGSADHPSPTKAAHAIPTESEIEAAEVQVTATQKALESARDGHRRLQSEVGAYKAQLEEMQESLGKIGDGEIDRLATEIPALLAKSKEADAAATQVTKLEAAVEKAKQLRAKLTEGKQTAETEAAAARESLAKVDGRLAQLSEEIDEQFRAPGYLEAQIKVNRNQIDVADHALAEARKAAADAKEAVASAVARSEELKVQTTAIAAELAVQEKAVIALATARPANESDDALQLAASEARELANQKIGALGRVGATLETRKKEDAQLQKIADESTKLEMVFGITGRLAEVATGTNDRRLNFHKFVLTAILDDVLVCATKRLENMSQRRFQLYRARDAKVAGGLDLEVMDHHTGVRRPVATLSGGESFLASLSLALGLADVTEAYAGGVRMETMFIDEGFGSLSSDALDEAFKTLHELQKGGRLVGVISHVQELKERIPTRLEVKSSPTGSIARFVL